MKAPDADEVQAGAGARRAVSARIEGWVAAGSGSVIAVAALAVLGTLKLALSLGGTFTSGGDVAFIELQVRQAEHFATAVGPYSRYGWHHPGPAVFYLFAPIYWLTGGDSRSLFLDAWLLNAACAVGVVAVIRNFAGEVSARVAAVVVALYLAASGFSASINPWNPSLLALPVLLVMVLTAAAVTGSAWSLLGATVVASVAAQTHIATVPVCAVCLVFAAVGYWRNSRGRPRWVATAAAVSIGLLWGPPLVQEFRGGQGNLTQLFRFYLHPPASAGSHSHSLSSALSAVSDYVTVVPAGNPTDLAHHAVRLGFAAVFAAAGTLAAVRWWGRRRFLAWLGLLTPIGLAVATLAAMRIVGPYEGYLFFWCQTLALPGVISILALGVEADVRWWTRPWVEPATNRVTLAAVALAAVICASVVARGATASYGDSPDARAAATVIEAAVGPTRPVFTLRVAQQNFADGPLILTLVKDGYRFGVDPGMDLYDGDTDRVAKGPVFVLGNAGSPAPPFSGRHLLTRGFLSVYER